MSKCDEKCKGCNWKEYVYPRYRVGEFRISDDPENRSVQINHFTGYPHALGHFVVQPSWSVKDVSDLDDPVGRKFLSSLGRIAQHMKIILKDIAPVERIYIYSFNESDDWHLHFHLVPRYQRENLKGPFLLTQELRALSERDKEETTKALQDRLVEDKSFLL